jgi:regulatory protein YycI of two-component signal transduction system YycFG
MSTSTKVIFIIAFLLLIYGYLCRLLNIYFFWDSKHFGWIMMATGLMGFFIDLKRILEAQGKNIFLIKVFIGIIIVAFGIAGGAIILLKSSKAYQDEIENIKIYEPLKSEIGSFRGIGLFPSGSGFLNFAFNLNPDPATFIITVRGSRAIKDIEITLYKSLPVE